MIILLVIKITCWTCTLRSTHITTVVTTFRHLLPLAIDPIVTFAPSPDIAVFSARFKCSMCKSQLMLQPAPPLEFTNLDHKNCFWRQGDRVSFWNCRYKASRAYFVLQELLKNKSKYVLPDPIYLNSISFLYRILKFSDEECCRQYHTSILPDMVWIPLSPLLLFLEFPCKPLQAFNLHDWLHVVL